MGEDAAGSCGGSAASAGAADEQQAGDPELLPAMGKIHGHGGQSGTPGIQFGGEPDGGGEPEREAERRIPTESRGIREEAGDPGKRRWRQRDLAGTAERVADCGAAGDGSDGSRVLDRKST